MADRKQTSRFDSTLFNIIGEVEETVEKALAQAIEEIGSAIGAVYDENDPRACMEDEEAYQRAVGARYALYDLCKEMELNPKLIREGWTNR